MKLTAKELAVAASDFVNSFSPDTEQFIKTMNTEHRTLQQSFTRLCLKWIENCASEDYRTDGRNEQTAKVSKELIEKFKAEHENFLPSDYLSYI